METVKRLRFSTDSPRVLSRLYSHFQKQQDSYPENIARHALLKVLVIVTTSITALFFSLLMLQYFVNKFEPAGPRLIVNGIVLVYMLGAYWVTRMERYRLSAYMLLLFYILISAITEWAWGINVPVGLLVMSITITLAGILLGARYSVYIAGLLSGLVIGMQILTSTKVHVPDTSWQNAMPSQMGEALGYCLLFAALAVVSWLFGRQTERALRQARTAEAALIRQKQLLAVRLKERTERLQAVQLKEIQQLYRFAELGQLSTALLHDLANHLTALTLDIDAIGVKRHAAEIERAKYSINYLDDLVAKVRKQLQDEGEITTFNCWHSLQALAASLRPKFTQANVELNIVQEGPKQHLQFEGDPVRFGQVMAIIMTNAIQASTSANGAKSRKVEVAIEASATAVIVRISDWGAGVPEREQKRLFKPFHTTKKDGMGIGLFISKQIVETHFKGTVELESPQGPTTFKVTLPHRKHHGHREHTDAQ